MVTLFAAICGSGEARAMVCGLAPAMLKPMAHGAAQPPLLARVTASRSEPLPESFVFVTVYDDDGGSTVKTALVAAVSESPPLADAATLTPPSATEYVTPLIVALFVPALMVPVSVPPR